MFDTKKLFVLVIILPTAGCSTIAKRAFKEARGAHSNLWVVPGTIHSDLSQYRDVEVAKAKNDLGGLVSPAFANALPKAIKSATTTGENPPFPGGNPVLRVEPQIQWYSDASGIKDVLGSTSFAVTLLWLKDGDREIGRVQIVTKNASSHDDEEDMAESMAREFAEWIVDLRQEPGDD